MAKCHPVLGPITVQEQVGVTLKLNMAEAQALRDIMAKIGGHPSTRRGHCDDIARALEAVGVDYCHSPNDLRPDNPRVLNTICFNDNE